VIKSGAVVRFAIIGENCVVGDGARVGERPEDMENRDDWGIAVVGHNITLSAGSRVPPKQIVSENL